MANQEARGRKVPRWSIWVLAAACALLLCSVSAWVGGKVRDGHWRSELRDSLERMEGPLTYGELELAAMLRDRPPMAEHIRFRDDLWKWAADRFEEVIRGDVLRWSSRQPQYKNQCQLVGNEVRILWEGGELGFTDLWRCFIFECCNRENHKVYEIFDGTPEETDEFIWLCKIFRAEEATEERAAPLAQRLIKPYVECGADMPGPALIGGSAEGWVRAAMIPGTRGYCWYRALHDHWLKFHQPESAPTGK